MENKISVIIIFFNTEKYISESIESVISQSYDNWELILVDDGSSDNSTAIALEFVKKYPTKIYYIEHDNHANKGMSASRNIGINKSNGEYIAFLDSDDVWLSNTLKDQIKVIESNPEVNVVYGRFENWFESDVSRDSYNLPIYQPEDHPVAKPGNIIHPPTLLTLYLEGNNYILPGICSMMIKKSVLVKLGGFVESFRGMFEDHVIKSKIFLQEDAYFIESILSKYRRHTESESIKVKTNQQKPLLKLIFLFWLEMYLSEKGFMNTDLWNSLQKNIQSIKNKLLQNERSQFRKNKDLNNKIVNGKENSKNYKIDSKNQKRKVSKLHKEVGHNKGLLKRKKCGKRHTYMFLKDFIVSNYSRFIQKLNFKKN